MKNIIFWLLFVCFFPINFLYAQDTATDNTDMAWWAQPISLPPNGNNIWSSPWDQPSSDPLGLSNTIGYWYCSSISSNIPNIQTCLGCVQNWQTASLTLGWVIACVAVEQLCSNAYSNASDWEKCNDKYIGCTDDWWSPDRCACKAIGGISLNTNVPFVGNCISLRASSSADTTQVTPTTAFPRLLAWLTKIVMTVILLFCFMAIVVGGVLISMGGASEEQAKKGKDLIKHVVMALALLGASGVILRVINPSFFS